MGQCAVVQAAWVRLTGAVHISFIPFSPHKVQHMNNPCSSPLSLVTSSKSVAQKPSMLLSLVPPFFLLRNYPCGFFESRSEQGPLHRNHYDNGRRNTLRSMVWSHKVLFHDHIVSLCSEYRDMTTSSLSSISSQKTVTILDQNSQYMFNV